MAVGLHPCGARVPSALPLCKTPPGLHLLLQHKGSAAPVGQTAADTAPWGCRDPCSRAEGGSTPVRSSPPSSEGYRRQPGLPTGGQAAPIPAYPSTHGPPCIIPFSPASRSPLFFDHEEAPEEKKLLQTPQPQPWGSAARHTHAPSSTHASLHVPATARSAFQGLHRYLSSPPFAFAKGFFPGFLAARGSEASSPTALAGTERPSHSAFKSRKHMLAASGGSSSSS